MFIHMTRILVLASIMTTFPLKLNYLNEKNPQKNFKSISKKNFLIDELMKKLDLLV